MNEDLKEDDGEAAWSLAIERAVTAWNTRATLSSQSTRIAELERTIEQQKGVNLEFQTRLHDAEKQWRTEMNNHAELQARCYEGFPSASDGIFDALKEADDMNKTLHNLMTTAERRGVDKATEEHQQKITELRTQLSTAQATIRAVREEASGPLWKRDGNPIAEKRLENILALLSLDPAQQGSEGPGDGEDTLAMVAEFHRSFGQSIYESPNISDAGTNALRVELIQEELKELCEALSAGDVIATLDALTDLQYVLDGAYLSLGLWRYKMAAFREVHRSNMSKLGADGKPVIRGDGKVLKGPNYFKPNIAAAMQSKG